MYPDLSYILHALLGIGPDGPTSIIKTFGLFLVIAFIVSAYLLKLELKRKEKLGLYQISEETNTIGKGPTVENVLPSAIFGFILAYKLAGIWQYWDQFLNDPATIILSDIGNAGVGILGMLLYGGWKYYSLQKNKLDKPKKVRVKLWPHQRVWDITVVAAVAGIIGAKLFAIFESIENLRNFLQDPIHTLLSGSGLAIYGGLIVAFVVVALYIKRYKMNMIYTMDAVAPALIAGYGVGRIGCQLAGDGDWGIVNHSASPSWWFLPDWLWAYNYPHNVLNRGELIPGCTWDYCYALSEPVFPTPLYEVMMAAVIFIILWSLRKRIKIPGVLFFIYVFLNGVERWFIEKIRINDHLQFFGIQLTQAELISLLLIIIGIIGIIYLSTTSKKRYPS